MKHYLSFLSQTSKSFESVVSLLYSDFLSKEYGIDCKEKTNEHSANKTAIEAKLLIDENTCLNENTI